MHRDIILGTRTTSSQIRSDASSGLRPIRNLRALSSQLKTVLDLPRRVEPKVVSAWIENAIPVFVHSRDRAEGNGQCRGGCVPRRDVLQAGIRHELLQRSRRWPGGGVGEQEYDVIGCSLARVLHIHLERVEESEIDIRRTRFFSGRDKILDMIRRLWAPLRPCKCEIRVVKTESKFEYGRASVPLVSAAWGIGRRVRSQGHVSHGDLVYVGGGVLGDWKTSRRCFGASEDVYECGTTTLSRISGPDKSVYLGHNPINIEK